MDFASNSEGPSILQLLKWEPFVQLNLSEFREGFISPTRELLLLLTCQCEALLLPLVKGEAINANISENCFNGSLQNLGSVAFSSPDFPVPSSLDVGENILKASVSQKAVSDDDLLVKTKFLSSDGCPFVCDVNSLAWGICGDMYNRHPESSFREFLFVSGNHGVTVHAFRSHIKASEVTESTLDGDIGEGMWVEWGPDAALTCNNEGHKIGFDLNRTNGSSMESEDDESRPDASRRWLRTFLIQVETLKSQSGLLTKFPERPSFPSSAMVVSFSIFGRDDPLLDLLDDWSSVSRTKESCADSNLDPSSSKFASTSLPTDIPSNLLASKISCSYKCCKVFSSNSCHFIGFVLTLVDQIVAGTCGVFEKNCSKIILVVARLVSWGIQWLCLVKLDESRYQGSSLEWTDFGFSNNFLVCLNAAGLIFFYSASTGEYVTHIDILQIHGLPHELNFNGQNKLSVKDVVPINSNVENRQDSSSSYREDDFVGRRIFRRLLVSSRTSFLAVIDEYGVIYVICACNHMPNEYSFEGSLSHLQHPMLETLVGWEVGSAEISCPRVLLDLRHRYDSKVSFGRNKNTTKDSIGSSTLFKVHDFKRKRDRCYSYSSGFSVASQNTEQKVCSPELPSQFIRKVFVPTDRQYESDVVCFSDFGITRLIRKCDTSRTGNFRIVHSNLHVDSSMNDDKCFDLQGWEVSVREAVGCSFQGCLYLVTNVGLSVVLPAVSVSSNFFPIEAVGYKQTSINADSVHQAGIIMNMRVLKQPLSPWKVEILDQILLYEGPEEADHLCLQNGWDLKISRMRRLQLALDYLKFEEVGISLEMLVEVNLAEEGILRLLFVAAYLVFDKGGNDNEVSGALRLLAIATTFATKMIHKYGLLRHKKDTFANIRALQNYSSMQILDSKEDNEMVNLRKLREMAHFLEIIRNLQCRLSAKFKGQSPNLVDGLGSIGLVDTDLSQDGLEHSIALAGELLLESSNQKEVSVPASNVELENGEELALMPIDSLDSKAPLEMEDFSGATILSSGKSGLGRIAFSLENPKDMISRWQLDNLDEKNVVKDALVSGRLPLAVLKLHLQNLKELVTDKEPNDTFTEVRDIGRAIAYDLFLKGETRLAVATLQKLGEDIENNLKELVFGTVNRSLRVQVAEEMKRYGYLGPYEWKILERIALIESFYTSSGFWGTFCCRQKAVLRVLTINSPDELNLRLLNKLFKRRVIGCGEIDGVVLGPWKNVSGHSMIHLANDGGDDAGFWAAAAVWSNAWDQATIDRIVLDRPFLMGVNVSWESQLEYHMCHNDWVEVSGLLDIIPSYSLSVGNLQICLDGLQSDSAVGCSSELADYGNYAFSVEEISAVCADVPCIRIFRFSTTNMSSMWLITLMEQQLAKKSIFLKEYWEGTAEIVPLLARSGFMTSIDESIKSSVEPDFSNISVASYPDAVRALHKIIVHHCVQYNLPILLDIYLDHHKLALDNDSLSELLDAAGDKQWAKWLLFLRVKGREYDASFSNARSIASHNSVPNNSLCVLEVDDIMRTVDDIAEGAGEMAALATLMYAPIPLQDCVSCGSVNMNSSSSAQCTLENLRPALQQFPTLWRTLVAACFGQDPTCNFAGSRTKIFGISDLSDYLTWRDNVFFSAGRDTSLLQMLPCWFPKSVRRLIQLYVQGPLGWQSLVGFPTAESFQIRYDYLVGSNEDAEVSAISWEAAIQKHVEEELYVSSPEKTGLGLEHHLHRGRPLAAFSHLLATRIEKFKFDNSSKGLSSTSAHGQANAQADVHALLSPLSPSEESLLGSVIPLAVMHFEDSMLVASCAFLLELCGLSASILRVDIAALRRISSFYKSDNNSDHYHRLSPEGSAFHCAPTEGDVTYSLAQALADYYLHCDIANIIRQEEITNSSTSKQHSRALILVLQHLEKASLPPLANGMTCGSWLSSGIGDGVELRSQQKVASQHWNLVTIFCQMHHIPLSTKYLGALARDNDWVGFLSEAQAGGYAFDTVVDIASNESTDPRLKVHMLTVLKNMQSRRKVGFPSMSDTTEGGGTPFLDESTYAPVELFQVIAECERQKNPGEALLLKAKLCSWSILALIASCFPDVSPLSCLTVWLEITANRETSLIKVSDIAAQIANNVCAAVEATNSLPASDRVVIFHYNRKSPKRRRLMEPTLVDALNFLTPNTSVSSTRSAASDIIAEEGRKKEVGEYAKVPIGSDEMLLSLSKMVAMLCEQHMFLPLLRAFEMFLPSCSLLPFIRALQAFSQMRLSEASAHLGSFSSRIKDEPLHIQINIGRELQIGCSWISSTAMKAADSVLSTCPSPYERRCLLQLLAATDFGDGGSAATYFRQLYWKINLAEPSLRKDAALHLGNESLNDASLLAALEKNGHWEHARNWAKQLEASGGQWKSAVHRVTEKQAESMVAEWKEFLWDVPEERIALWGHCQTLFLRYSVPPLQAGLFFLKHAEAVEKDLPARELHELLLLSLQWLSGMITQTNPVYPLNLLREIETRVWLIAVESEAQVKSEGDLTTITLNWDSGTRKSSSIIDHTANMITKMDNHITAIRVKSAERNDTREINQTHQKMSQVFDSSFSTSSGATSKAKRRAKGISSSRRPLVDTTDKIPDAEDGSLPPIPKNDSYVQDETFRIESLSRWEERVGPVELERAVLSLLEFGQITAAKQLQHKLSPTHIPSEFTLVDAALKLAALSVPSNKISPSMLDDELHSIIHLYSLPTDQHLVDTLQVLESLTTIFTEGSGRGLCKRIVSVVKAANVLGLSFLEAFDKQPIELLQLLSLKAQDSFEEANLLVQTHSMPAASIAQILAESFLKGLLAAHRGGYIDSQKEEGPAPLLWRFSDFLKWAELCPSEPEIGHALMRLVITGQEIPHTCEVELLILSHHFYKSSACLDGVDVLVALAATRVEAYVSEGDFPCLARLITGVGNFHALNFILGILIENGQLDLLLQKYSAAADTNTGTAEAVRGFRMAVLTSLKQFNPNDLDAFAMVYNHFDMKHETASLLESRAQQSTQQWFLSYDGDQNEDLLEAMRYFIEAAKVHSSIDAGNKTRAACARASLVSLQIRMPDFRWLNLSDTNARRALVEQSRFQEALIVAEAYDLNQPSEWALVLWNQMLKPELTEEFVAEFVAVLPLQPSMLAELARFYRAEVAARGDQSQFSVWLTGGSFPAEWAKYLGRSFRCLLKRTRDLRLRLHLATIATGFGDVVDACTKALDKFPDTWPLVLRRGHGGAYLPLM